MKTIVKFSLASLACVAVACGEDGPAVDETQAASIAENLVGGEAGEIERGIEGTIDVWEVHVTMPNAGEIEVKVDVTTADVVVVEDKVGPFDYASFTPADGVLSYDEITDVALGEVAGEVEAWEFKREIEAGELFFEWEFYVRDAENQLWEIKFDATDGTVTELEPKDMVDP